MKQVPVNVISTCMTISVIRRNFKKSHLTLDFFPEQDSTHLWWHISTSYMKRIDIIYVELRVNNGNIINIYHIIILITLKSLIEVFFFLIFFLKVNFTTTHVNDYIFGISKST